MRPKMLRRCRQHFARAPLSQAALPSVAPWLLSADMVSSHGRIVREDRLLMRHIPQRWRLRQSEARDARSDGARRCPERPRQHRRLCLTVRGVDEPRCRLSLTRITAAVPQSVFAEATGVHRTASRDDSSSPSTTTKRRGAAVSIILRCLMRRQSF
jgi:hypothetical protein